MLPRKRVVGALQLLARKTIAVSVDWASDMVSFRLQLSEIRDSGDQHIFARTWDMLQGFVVRCTRQQILCRAPSPDRLRRWQSYMREPTLPGFHVSSSLSSQDNTLNMTSKQCVWRRDGWWLWRRLGRGDGESEGDPRALEITTRCNAPLQSLPQSGYLQYGLMS